MKRCAGVCAGKETPAEHDERLLGALSGKGLKPWPWSGPVLVSEHDPATGRTAVHLLDAWCYLATEDTAGAARARLDTATYAFDLDIYRLLLRWFDAPAHRQAACLAAD